MDADQKHFFEPVKTPLLRYMLFAVGSTSVVLGFIGIFLPVLPTTPFMILAAMCYAKSSRRFYEWIIYNRYFGEPVRQWLHTRTMPRKARRAAVILIVISFGISIAVVDVLALQLMLITLASILLFFIVRIPVRDDATVGNGDKNTKPADQS